MEINIILDKTTLLTYESEHIPCVGDTIDLQDRFGEEYNVLVKSREFNVQAHIKDEACGSVDLKCI